MTVESRFISAKQSLRSSHGKTKQKTTKTVNATRQHCPLQSGTAWGRCSWAHTSSPQPLLKVSWELAAGATAIPGTLHLQVVPISLRDFISARTQAAAKMRTEAPCQSDTGETKGKGDLKACGRAGEIAQ